MSDNVIDSLVIKLGLDVEELKRNINDAQNQLKTLDNKIDQTQKKTEKQGSSFFQKIFGTVKTVEKGAEQATKGLDSLLGGTQKLDAAFSRLDTTVMGKLKSVVSTIVAPVAGVLAVGGAIQNYIGGVAEVARLTGQYSQKLEEWRYKQQLMARVTKEEIELYIKGQRALKSFRLTMHDLVSYGMRAAVPFIEKASRSFEKAVNWIKANDKDVIRFFKVLASVITIALIPAFIKLAAAIWANPLTWLIAALVASALVLDDFITYINGGKSAFEGLWQKLGDGPTLLKKIEGFFNDVKNKLDELGPIILRVGLAFAVFKVATTIVNGLILAIKALRLALLSNPVTAILFVIGSVIMWLYDVWQRAGGDWGKVVDIIASDLWGLVDTVRQIWDTIKGIFSNTFKWILNGLDDDFKKFVEDLVRKIPLMGNTIADWLHNVWSDDENAEKSININTETDAPIIPGMDNYDSSGDTYKNYPLAKNYQISSPFGMRQHPITGQYKMHQGIDFATPVGTPVLAPADGKVSMVTNSKTGGLMMYVDHAGGYRSVYMHLSKINVHAGQKVKKGQEIAKSGNTGRSTGAHLHYGLMKNGKYVDPLYTVIPNPDTNGKGSSSSKDTTANINKEHSTEISQDNSAPTQNPHATAASAFTPDSFDNPDYKQYKQKFNASVNYLSNGLDYMSSIGGGSAYSKPIPVNAQAVSNIQNSNRGGNVVNRNGDINVTVNTNSNRPGEIADRTATKISQTENTDLVYAMESGQRT